VAAGYHAARERRLAWARVVRGTPALQGAYLELLAEFETAIADFAAGRQTGRGAQGADRAEAQEAAEGGAPAPEGAPGAVGRGAAGARSTRPRLQAAVTVAAFRLALEVWEAGDDDLPALVAEHLGLLEGDLWR